MPLQREAAWWRTTTHFTVLASPELEAICTIPYLRVDIPLKVKGLSSSVGIKKLAEPLQKMILSVYCAQDVIPIDAY